MHVGIGEGVSARRVRVSFRGAHPPARHQYYTVRELTLAARCLCHGHAELCTVDQKSAKCSCVNGACGAHCQRCCSGATWQEGQPCEGSQDNNECSCGERGACSYDDTGAILCVNCTDNRAGPLCNRCLIGYYNVFPDDACQPCDCDPEGSDVFTGTCKWNKKKHHVICSCNPGFTGFQCENCENPNAVFPNCLVEVTTATCKCDPRGIVDPGRVCDEICECKANVIGERCDTCAPGHFGLSASLQGGCRACYCSHQASHCEPDPRPGTDVLYPLGDTWLISDNETTETVVPSIDEHGKPYLISYEVEGWDSYYFVSSYLSGQQLSLYGGTLLSRVSWGVARGDSGGSSSRAPDYLLVAKDGSKLKYGNTSYETPGLIELVAPLKEGGWYLNSEVATRSQLLDVLGDLNVLMIRAHFHFDQDEVRLESSSVRGSPGGSRERCSCGVQLTGAQCESCAAGHVRLQRARGAEPAFECVPCACNMHADCETVDGPCGPCQHNTTGPHCERCLSGHYGNPVQGACKRCACPLYETSNNFSPNCALAAAAGDDYVCTQCPDGYAGDHCEICDSGYWGSPITLGGSCQPCDCGGGPCHAQSGACLVCPPHTEGERCDQCQEGYWSGGENGSCIACGCGAGALSAACDARAGHCACGPGWTGRACDECAPGHGNVSGGCPSCACGRGSMSVQCGAERGECSCAPGAAPPRCDRCLEEYYELSATGCLGCNCSSLGSESNVCDIRTGQCRCRTHVTGRACDTCEEGYWGLQRGGCRRCQCGAGAAACEPADGACACASGAAGPRCDRCLPGYYGFGPAGCLPCPTCTEGRVCSPTSGRCVCPPRTRGPGCGRCARGHWGPAPACRPCACGPGAATGDCDAASGECSCRSGWTGRACDRCERGHSGPRCKPCACHRAGTRCEGDVCDCDRTGRCPCKENVVGEKCDKCLEGTFGLSETNPAGCTACFCFGRSAHCSQAAVTRAALHAATPLHLRLATGRGTATVDRRSQLAIHATVRDAHVTLPDPPVPVYAELSKLFLGDRVLSYGGALRFRVEQEGGVSLPPDVLFDFPLVSIYGYNIVLDYYERIPPANNTYAVYLHESLWRVRGAEAGFAGASEPVASRGALMITLRDVRRVLLRVSTRAPTDEPLHVLLLNVSLETAVPGLSRGAPALGVERCACPHGYSAASCQRPAAGFWMPPAPPLITHAAGTIIIEVEPAKPCDCNGRAVACNPIDGHCLNCTDDTTGPNCERCAEGYYGTPEHGCEPCPCPAGGPVRATNCAAAHGRLHCYCRTGYAGATCERCAAGWKRAGGGACEPCQCSTQGALSPHCEAGRCRCRPHAAGARCELCVRPGYYMDEDGCKPCDNCTQTLLHSIKNLSQDLRSRADLSELSRIPQPFPALRAFSQNASTLQTLLLPLRRNKENTQLIESALQKLEATEHDLFTAANKFKIEVSRREREAQSLSLESMSGLEDVFKQKRLLAEEIAKLDEFARGERHLSAHKALKEARHLLKKIKILNLVDFMTGATDVSDSANLQSTSAHEYKYRIDDAFQRIHRLQAGLDEWERKAEDLPRLAAAVWVVGDAVGSAGVGHRLARVRDMGLQCRLVLEDISELSTHNLTEETRSALLYTQNLAVGFPELLAILQNLTSRAEEKEGILYNLTPKYKEKYLESVKKHVEMLENKAKEYKNLFAGTRALASAGVQAARAWAEVAAGVRDAAAAADAATAAAATAAKLARGPQPLIATADEEKAASEILKSRGGELLTKSNDLSRQLEIAHRGTDAISVGLRGLGWQERALAAGAEGGMMNGSGAAMATLKQAGTQAERVFASSRVLYDEAADLRRKVRYQLRRNLAALQRLGDTALGAAEEHVSQIRGNTERGREVSRSLQAAGAARALEHAAAGASLAPPLRRLRSAGLRARHAADTISVSMTSPAGGVGCVRAYSAWSAPAATRATLSLTFDSRLRDGTLLFLPDQESSRYLRLSVSGGRLVARWDVGGGEGLLEHPEPLTPTLDDADRTVYRLQLERVWNTVRLRVERSGSVVSMSSNSTSTSAGAGLLRPQYWWLGEPESPLPACVHSLHADHTAMGLWAFAKQPPKAKCTGCTQRWPAARGEGLVRLGGAGYASLRRSRPADRRRFSLALSFRTTDHQALLFMAHDHANNRSVSVWVRDCRVVFKVQYASSLLEITAGGDHCDGRPAHVQATRVFNGLERGSLRVNGEETLGSPSPPVQTAADLPELEGAYWVGGLPPEAQGLYDAPSLLGCIGGLVVDREGYDLLDTPTRYGLEPGCSARALRSAVLDGDGYIEIASPAIRRKSSIGISFSTRIPSGLILYRAPAVSIQDNEVDEDGDDSHYLVLALVKGELEIIANAGKAELRLRANGTKLDDGGLYTVRLVRVHKQLEVWVDEKRVATGALPGGAIAARSRGLYLGGSPSPVSYLAVPPFTGTVADFIVDSAWSDLSTAVSRMRAGVGRARPAAPRPAAAPATSDPAYCSKLSSYAVEAGAVKFGDAVPSYATLRVARADDFAFGLQLRTFAGDGIIMLLPGSKQKPRHYVALLLREGRPRLVVRGRRRKELTLPGNFSDGEWHELSVRISRKRLVLSSGGAAAAGRAPPHARSARLYLGGPPPAALVPNVPNSLLRAGGLVGCVRRVRVGGRVEDPVRDARAHVAVSQCFPHVERGAYFGGDAYAEWAEPSGAGSGEGEEGDSVELRLEFRASGGSGLLAAFAGAVLELKDGMVVLSRGGSSAEGGGAVCDGRWHAAAARVWRAGVSLSLDAAPAERAAPALLAPAPPPPARALYVAGLPEGARDVGEGRENFKGCVRDVRYRGTARGWRQAQLHHVLLDSCPRGQ